MSAQDVWECLKVYNPDQAKDILKAYNHDERAIIRVLGTYPGKDAYHGHKSGRSGDDSSPEAITNREAAINHLKANKPTGGSTSTRTGTRVTNHSSMMSNRSRTEALVTIIDDNDNLGTMKDRLDEADPDWENVREVWQAYSLKYRAKRNKPPTKRT